MSSVKIQGSATGTANFTIAVPDGTSTDRTINLPDAAGSFVLADASGNVDITGTVTADRLTADASGEAILSLNGYTASQDTEVQLVAVRDDVSTSKSLLDIKTNDGSSLVRRIRIDSSGNFLVAESKRMRPSRSLSRGADMQRRQDSCVPTTFRVKLPNKEPLPLPLPFMHILSDGVGARRTAVV